MQATNKKTRWMVGGGVVAAIACAVLALSGAGGLPFGKRPQTAAAPDPTRSAPKAVAVTVAPVTARPLQRLVDVVGTLYGYEEALITPKIEGRVIKLHHDVGDVVKPGDVLLEIDDVDYRLAVTEAEKALQLELAKIGLDSLPKGEFDPQQLPPVVRAKSVEENAKLKLTRAEELFGKAVVTQEQYDQTQADFRVAKAMYEQAIMDANATLATARHRLAVLETARQKLTDTSVRAPTPSAERLDQIRRELATVSPELAAKVDMSAVEFVVAERMVSEGEMVRSFPSIAAFRLVIDRPLKLRGSLPERYVAEVTVGQHVKLGVEAYPDEEFDGVVSRVNPTVDRASRSCQVEVHVPNHDRRLRAGSFVKGLIATRIDESVPTVPEESLVTFAGVTKVFVIEGSKARTVILQPGLKLDVSDEQGKVHAWFETPRVLQPGMSVVTSGQTQLAEGTAVRVKAGPDEASRP